MISCISACGDAREGGVLCGRWPVVTVLRTKLCVWYYIVDSDICVIEFCVLCVVDESIWYVS